MKTVHGILGMLIFCANENCKLTFMSYWYLQEPSTCRIQLYINWKTCNLDQLNGGKLNHMTIARALKHFYEANRIWITRKGPVSFEHKSIHKSSWINVCSFNGTAKISWHCPLNFILHFKNCYFFVKINSLGQNYYHHS